MDILHPTGDHLPVPSDALNISAPWFEALFKAHGITADIKSVSAAPIGNGLMGSNFRYVFDYASCDQAAPHALVGKFPSTALQTRQSEGVVQAYLQEVSFYQQFAPTAGRIAPRAWFSRTDETSDDFAIFLEDLSPLKPIALLDGCGFDDACLAMDMAAHLHASHWQDSSLDTLSWLSGTSQKPTQILPLEIMQQCWQEFQQRYEQQLTLEEKAVGQQFVDAFADWCGGYSGPVCLAHRDFRLENVLFGEPYAARSAAVVDWQLIALAAPAIDVAFFIGSSLKESVRREHEQTLLAHYHAALLQRGVEGYTYEDFLQHYAWYSFWGINVAVGSMMFDRSDEGDRMLLAMYQRQARQIIENDYLSVLASD